MTDRTAISAKQLSKIYRIYGRPSDRLRQFLFPARRYFQDIHALKNVSFDIRKGSVTGIIGRNGAGKSTLLQILASVLQPTEGSLEINGRVLSILELGSGFNYDFTGRENLLHYGLTIGQSRRQIESHMAKIIEFADIGDFIDRPVKTYSNGMVMRLAFSMVAACRADILIVDEVMSVGDVNFQMKCLRWMNRFVHDGGTICLVSHDLNLVANKCDQVILLKEGGVAARGTPLDVIPQLRYDQPVLHAAHAAGTEGPRVPGVPAGDAGLGRMTSATVNGQVLGHELTLSPGSSISIAMEAVFLQPVKDYTFGASLMTANGVDLFSISSRLAKVHHPDLRTGRPVRCLLTIRQNLQPGVYYLQLGIGSQVAKDAAEFIDISSSYSKLHVLGVSPTFGYVDFPFSVEFPRQAPD
ncbi:MAG: ABC transporter ATP-binding protein [Elusimicrobia bacterium]|nr:ABC transporter ATP-binding protein [Elusimicrobiota bacterium]